MTCDRSYTCSYLSPDVFMKHTVLDISPLTRFLIIDGVAKSRMRPSLRAVGKMTVNRDIVKLITGHIRPFVTKVNKAVGAFQPSLLHVPDSEQPSNVVQLTMQVLQVTEIGGLLDELIVEVDAVKTIDFGTVNTRLLVGWVENVTVPHSLLVCLQLCNVVSLAGLVFGVSLFVGVVEGAKKLAETQAILVTVLVDDIRLILVVVKTSEGVILVASNAVGILDRLWTVEVELGSPCG